MALVALTIISDHLVLRPTGGGLIRGYTANQTRSVCNDLSEDAIAYPPRVFNSLDGLVAQCEYDEHIRSVTLGLSEMGSHRLSASIMRLFGAERSGALAIGTDGRRPDVKSHRHVASSHIGETAQLAYRHAGGMSPSRTAQDYR